jgi:sulfite reductase (NADPH) flavoprotein alpha-component
MASGVLTEQIGPFSEDQMRALHTVLSGLTREQQIWLSGYLAAGGFSAGTDPMLPSPLQQTEAGHADNRSTALTVLYGTETGNCRNLAGRFLRKAETAGVSAEMEDLADFNARKLNNLQNIVVITSTHGDGEPPEPIRPFVAYLQGRRAPGLQGKRFSVLALGDSSYEYFCQTGRELDTRLEELGGERIYPRVDCDVDFEEDSEVWMSAVLEKLASATQTAPIQSAARVSTPAPGTPAAITYSRTNPFQAEVLENINLNDSGSTKVTRHLELSLQDSGVSFAPGDALGIIPRNHSGDVDHLIDILKLDPNEPVPVARQSEKPLRQALIEDYEISRLTPRVLENYAQFSRNGLSDLVREKNRKKLRTYLEGRDVIDLLSDYAPAQITSCELLGLLRKMPRRLYSIASSLRAYPDEVHLTVALDQFWGANGSRFGVCSRQCHEQAAEGTLLKVYVQENPAFHLPGDPARPIIMIGPGTGVAPFRAFLQEREELGIDSPAWLFFGDRHFRTDFLYQAEWQKWLRDGVLTRMDVAFSRDQTEKVYIQHRMRDKGRDLYTWLEDGAIFYVCGDAKRMAHDVHEELIGIVETHGKRSRREAEEYVETMKVEKRYLRDVY